MTDRVDPRITRTAHAVEEAIVGLAAEQPVSRITVAALAERAGVTRATVYNRYGGPLDVLIQVLYRDLERGHRREEELRTDGTLSAEELLRSATAEVVDHVERFRRVYEQALGDPADRGVYDALVRHFSDYALAFMEQRSAKPDVPGVPGVPGVPDAPRGVLAAFVAHGFAGAIVAWLDDGALSKEDLVAAAVACAPAWWG